MRQFISGRALALRRFLFLTDSTHLHHLANVVGSKGSFAGRVAVIDSDCADLLGELDGEVVKRYDAATGADDETVHRFADVVGRLVYDLGDVMQLLLQHRLGIGVSQHLLTLINVSVVDSPPATPALSVTRRIDTLLDCRIVVVDS
ncbi:MAG: hypothetical protein ACI9NC_006448 [Verrucomicrobiales bacterium]|jgi:hypothetical protein